MVHGLVVSSVTSEILVSCKSIQFVDYNHVKSEDTRITWLATLVSEISSYSWDNSVILSK